MPVPLSSRDLHAKTLKIGGFRYISPYFYEVRAKLGQFAGDAITPALKQTKVLQGMSPEWWDKELGRGQVCIERCEWARIALDPVNSSYIVRPDDVARVRIHVHERVVPDVTPDIVYEDDDYLVICKPAGLDIFENPTTGTVKSSALGLLSVHGYRYLKPVHRIDTPVSGIVCMAKTDKGFYRLKKSIWKGRVRKTYLAKVLVKDTVPVEGLVIDAPMKVAVDNQTLRPKAFIDHVAGKPARTEIRRILRQNYDDTLLLEVGIETGRMHQIRCHLQHAGFPIGNDNKYGGDRGRATLVYQDNRNQDLRKMVEQHQQEHCHKCQYFLNVLDGKEPAPVVVDGIWLHSWKYQFPKLDLEFQAPPPEWALTGN